MPKFSLDNPRDRALAIRNLNKGNRDLAKGWAASAFVAAHIPQPYRSRVVSARGKVAEGLQELHKIQKELTTERSRIR